MAGIRLRNVLVLIKDLPKGIEFYNKGLGLPVKVASDTFAEFDIGSPTHSLILTQQDSVAETITGYSPFLNFDVDDMDSTIVRVLGMGAQLDGPIKYPIHGKAAVIRSPDGQMIGLYESDGMA